MTKFSAKFFTFIFLLMIIACQNSLENVTEESQVNSQKLSENTKNIEKFQKAIKAVEPFFKPMGEPEEYDWLSFNQENGQTFAEYIAGNPNIPNAERNKIYIQPLGKFSEKQKKVLQSASEFLSNSFLLEVQILPVKVFPEPLSLKNHRIHPTWKTRQIRSGYIMDEILKPALPPDAVALIAFTNEDLYPDKSMSFIFGQANLFERIGVWSLYHLEDKKNPEKLLIRTLKISVHETGHIFSITHCTKYQCIMSGANHLGETDRHPLDACPECMAKICWLNNKTPVERYQRLKEFCEKYGLKEDAKLFNEKLKAVSF